MMGVSGQLLVAAAAVVVALVNGGDNLLPQRPRGTVLTRCEAGSPDGKEGRAALDRLRTAIEGLTDTSDPAPAIASLRSLLRMRCFALASEHTELPAPSHALALKTWWQNGGEQWLSSYLSSPRAGRLPDLHTAIVIPPAMLPVLFRETTNDKALAPLLCSQADATCGLE